MPFLVIVMLFFAILAANANQLTTNGEYRVSLSSVTTASTFGTASATALISIDVPPGSDDVYVPLPFVLSSNGHIIIQSDYNEKLVLYGDMRPNTGYSLLVIRPGGSQTQLDITLTEVLLPLGPAPQVNYSESLLLLFGDAFNEAHRRYGDFNFPALVQATIESVNVQYSEPPGRPSGFDSGYTVPLNGSGIPPNITLYLSVQSDPLIRFGLPLLLALPPAFVGGLAIPKPKRMSLTILIVSVLVLLVLIGGVYLFRNALIPNAGTDIMLAFWGFVGLLSALAVSSIYTLRSGRQISIVVAN